MVCLKSGLGSALYHAHQVCFHNCELHADAWKLLPDQKGINSAAHRHSVGKRFKVRTTKLVLSHFSVWQATVHEQALCFSMFRHLWKHITAANISFAVQQMPDGSKTYTSALTCWYYTPQGGGCVIDPVSARSPPNYSIVSIMWFPETLRDY